MFKWTKVRMEKLRWEWSSYSGKSTKSGNEVQCERCIKIENEVIKVGIK